MRALIGVERLPTNDYRVFTESLWDDSGYIDYAGDLEGMVGEVYETFDEIEDAVNVLLDQKVEVDIVEVKD